MKIKNSFSCKKIKKAWEVLNKHTAVLCSAVKNNMTNIKPANQIFFSSCTKKVGLMEHNTECNNHVSSNEEKARQL
jgi:hypothetical protein